MGFSNFWVMLLIPFLPFWAGPFRLRRIFIHRNRSCSRLLLVVGAIVHPTFRDTMVFPVLESRLERSSLHGFAHIGELSHVHGLSHLARRLGEPDIISEQIVHLRGALEAEIFQSLLTPVLYPVDVCRFQCPGLHGLLDVRSSREIRFLPLRARPLWVPGNFV